MRHIKTFEKFYLEDSELITTFDNADKPTKKQYPYVRFLKIWDLKKLENFSNYKEFLDEILKGKLIEPFNLPKFRVRNIKIEDISPSLSSTVFANKKIIAYLNNNTFNVLDDKIIIYHETEPKIGKQEKLANEFLEMTKDVNKYNL